MLMLPPRLLESQRLGPHSLLRTVKSLVNDEGQKPTRVVVALNAYFAGHALDSADETG